MTDENLPLAPGADTVPEVQATAAAKRSRKPRKAKEKTQRRRRGSNDASMGLKLEVGFEKDPDYTYRWINAGIDDQRLTDKTVRDDWDVVSMDGEPSDNTGDAVRRAVGSTGGEPLYSYLCRKPKDLHEEDQRTKQKHNDDLMAAVKGGRAPIPAGTGLSEADHVHGEGVTVKGRL